MSVCFDIKEHLVVNRTEQKDGITSKNKIVDAMVSQLSLLGTEMHRQTLTEVYQMELIADGVTYAFSDDCPDESLKKIMTTIEKADEIDFQAEYCFDWHADNADPFKLASVLETMCEEELNGIFYSLWSNADCDDGEGTLTAFGDHNGRMYNGEAKTAGNYASSLKGSEIAAKQGYSQTLWLDGKENKYVEEVGSMNIFFKIAGKVITPALNGSILPGITRDSMIQVLKSKNIPVEERAVAFEEVLAAAKDGTLEEVFGTGTAAVISPVGELKWLDDIITVNHGQIGEVTQMLYDTLTGIQYGKLEDSFGWIVKL